MTDEQRQHLRDLQAEIISLVEAKYVNGAKEHGGNIWDNPDLIAEAINETTDLMVYLLTVKNKLNKEAGVIQIVRDEKARQFPLPTPKKAEDVGFDLYTKEDTIIPPNEKTPTDVPTGIKIKLPKGYFALVINRSSTPRNLGIEVVPGVIDTGYTGELYACCFNRTGHGIMVKAGTRLAQFIVLPAIVPKVIEMDELPRTERGETGFGSTNNEQQTK